MELKRTWIYCRVAHSGPDSAKLLEGQQLVLENYARDHGLQIVGASSDKGSGLTFDRPGLLDFLDAVDDEAVDVLLLLELDRLGRNVSKVFWYWQMLRGRGIQIKTVMDGDVDLGIYEMFQKTIGK